MDFGGALQYLKDGKRVARTGWNGKGMWLKLQVPDAHSKMQRPYIYMSPADGLLVPWLASQTDMLADDWCVLGETYKVAGDTHDMTGTLGGLPQAPGPRAEDYSEKEKPRAGASVAVNRVAIYAQRYIHSMHAIGQCFETGTPGWMLEGAVAAMEKEAPADETDAPAAEGAAAQPPSYISCPGCGGMGRGPAWRCGWCDGTGVTTTKDWRG